MSSAAKFGLLAGAQGLLGTMHQIGTEEHNRRLREAELARQEYLDRMRKGQDLMFKGGAMDPQAAADNYGVDPGFYQKYQADLQAEKDRKSQVDDLNLEIKQAQLERLQDDGLEQGHIVSLLQQYTPESVDKYVSSQKASDLVRYKSSDDGRVITARIGDEQVTGRIENGVLVPLKTASGEEVRGDLYKQQGIPAAEEWIPQRAQEIRAQAQKVREDFLEENPYREAPPLPSVAEAKRQAQEEYAQYYSAPQQQPAQPASGAPGLLNPYSSNTDDKWAQFSSPALGPPPVQPTGGEGSTPSNPIVVSSPEDMKQVPSGSWVKDSRSGLVRMKP